MMGNKVPSLVTLVVTYNGERHIEKLLSSIPEETRVIIVDNASTDATMDKVTSFASKLHIETVLLTTNRGYAAGINAGMKYIADSADWVLVLNQDIVLSPTAYSLRLAAYNAYAIIQPRILLPNGTVNVDELRMNVWGFVYPPEYATAPLVKEAKETILFSGAAFLLNIAKYQQIGPFNESLFMYYEDVDYALRLRAQGKKVLFDPTWIVTHNYHPSTSSARKIRALLKNRSIIMACYASPLHQLLSLSVFSWFKKDNPASSHGLSTIALLPGFHTRQIRQPLRLLINLFAVPMGKLLLTILTHRERSTT